MFDELIKNSNYNVFIPSLQNYVKFKPLNILQYKKIIASSYNNVLNLGFKLSLFEILENNKLDSNFIPTEFDLYVYGLYVRYYDVSEYYKQQEISLKQPLNYTAANNFKIKFCIPTIQQFFDYTKYVNGLISKTKNDLLISELAKYADFEQLIFSEKIEHLKTFSIEDLNNHLKNIDIYKQSINNILQVNDSIHLPFNSALILE